MNNSKERQELKDLSQIFASEIGKFQKILADNLTANPDKADPAVMSQITSCMNAMYSIANNLHNRMDRMQASHFAYQDSHASGHLPACPSTEHMAKAMKALGWNGNYQIEKKKIIASKDLFDINLGKNK